MAQIISETAFVCIYLVYQLGQLVNITSTVPGLAWLMEKLKDYKKEIDNGEDLDVVISNDMVDDVATGLLVQGEKSLKASSTNQSCT